MRLNWALREIPLFWVSMVEVFIRLDKGDLSGGISFCGIRMKMTEGENEETDLFWETLIQFR